MLTVMLVPLVMLTTWTTATPPLDELPPSLVIVPLWGNEEIVVLGR